MTVIFGFDVFSTMTLPFDEALTPANAGSEAGTVDVRS
jgi:hypothetical protein